MNGKSVADVMKRSCRLGALRLGRDGTTEEGFTLIELLLVLVILPLVIGAITIVMITTFKATDPHDSQGTAERLAESHDAQITSAQFVRDVQSATLIENQPTALCLAPGASGVQLVGLEWNINQTSVGKTYVSYVVSTINGQSEVQRFLCTSSSPSTPPTCSSAPACTTTVAHKVKPPTTTTLTCNSSYSNTGCVNGTSSQGPFSALYVSLVTIAIPENSGSFTFTLSASPRQTQTVCNTAGSCPIAPPPLVLLGSQGVSCAAGNGSVTVNGAAATNSGQGTLDFHNGELTAQQVYSQNLNTTYPGTSSTATVSPPSDYNYTGASGGPQYTTGPSLTDAYSSLPPPSTSPPTFFYGPSTPLSAGNDGASNLKSGVYYLEDGINLTGNTSLTSEAGGVFFYVTGGSVSIGGSGSINLTAMSTGPYAGVLLYQVPTDSQQVTLYGGGSATSLNGVVAAPAASVSLQGNGNVAVYGLEASSVSCNGNGSAILGPPLATTTTVASSQNPSVVGQNVTFTATVASSPAGYPSPTQGSVTFTATASGSTNPTTLCSAVSLSGSSASCTTNTLLPVGSPWTITASYSGTSGYNPSSGSVNQTVVLSGLTLSSSQNPSVSGQSVTFTATVTGVLPTGPVTFTVTDKHNTTYSCTGASNTKNLSGGSASCTIASGQLLSTNAPFVVNAAYGGDGINPPSSGGLTQNVNANAVHIGSLTGSGSVTGSHWRATVVVTFVDSLGNPVAGVNVTGTFSPSASPSGGGPSASNGQVTFTTGNIPNSTSSETWTVSTVTAPSGYSYDSSSNSANSVNIPR